MHWHVDLPCLMFARGLTCIDLQAEPLWSMRKDGAGTSASHEFNHTDSHGHNTHLSYEVAWLCSDCLAALYQDLHSLLCRQSCGLMWSF